MKKKTKSCPQHLHPSSPAVQEPLNPNEYVCASPVGPGGAHLSVTVQTLHKAPAGSDLYYNSSHSAVTEGPFTGR